MPSTQTQFGPTHFLPRFSILQCCCRSDEVLFSKGQQECISAGHMDRLADQPAVTCSTVQISSRHEISSTVRREENKTSQVVQQRSHNAHLPWTWRPQAQSQPPAQPLETQEHCGNVMNTKSESESFLPPSADANLNPQKQCWIRCSWRDFDGKRRETPQKVEMPSDCPPEIGVHQCSCIPVWQEGSWLSCAELTGYSCCCCPGRHHCYVAWDL